MVINLPRDLELLVEKEVSEGRFPSAEDLVSQAVRVQLEELATFRALLDDAEAEADRDGWLSADQVKRSLKAYSKE